MRLRSICFLLTGLLVYATLTSAPAFGCIGDQQACLPTAGPSNPNSCANCCSGCAAASGGGVVCVACGVQANDQVVELPFNPPPASIVLTSFVQRGIPAYVLDSLPTQGSLLDGDGNPITSVPYALPNENLTYIAFDNDIAGFAVDKFKFHIEWNGRTSAATVTIDIDYPIPGLSHISPDSAIAGSPDVPIKVYGQHFYPNSVVTWDDGPTLATTYHSDTELDALIPAAYLTTPSNTNYVRVVNPAPGNGKSTAAVFTILPCYNQAKFISQSVPTLMKPGQSYAVTVSMQNNGCNDWQDPNTLGGVDYGYRLGSQNPQDNATWGIGRVSVNGTVPPGDSKVFNFNVTAPATPGTYNFQWQMVQDNFQWFGDLTSNVSVQVVAPPVITRFTATPDVIAKGQSSQLEWTTTHATHVSIDQGISQVPVNGDTTVSPTVTTVYTLTAENDAGMTVSQQVTVIVSCNPNNCPMPPNSCLPDQTCVAPPVINSFTATPDTIAKGQTSLLDWKTTNATEVSIDQGLGAVAVTGTHVASPLITTTYTLTAKNAAGVSVTKEVTVTVACNSNNCPMPPNMCLPDQTCVTPAAPVINSFTATPDTIAKGQTSQLAWTTTHATEVSIDHGIGAVTVNGGHAVSPSVTTTYLLTAKNAAGVSVTKPVTVTVECNPNNCPMPPNLCLPDQTCVEPEAPVINSFTATPDTIAKGQTSQLAWTTTHATHVSIDRGVGVVSLNGNTTVSPTVTTVYTLTAENDAGVTVRQEVTVTVACNATNCPMPPNMCLPDQTCVTPPAPVINSFTATPDTIAKGQTSQLAWTTSDATDVSIDQGVGVVSLNGTTDVSPSLTTIYTLTAKNAAGVSVTQQVTVTVACNSNNCPMPPNMCLPDQTCVTPAAPVINSFTATPDTIAKGQSSQLAWTTTNATDVSIDQGLGVVAVDGDQMVRPTVTTTYILTAKNAAGVSVTQQVTVTVACNSNNCPMPPNMCLPDQTCVTPPAPVVNSFTATPDTIANGQSSQLAWTTTNATEVSIDQGVGVVALNGDHTVSPTMTTVYTLTAKNAAGVSVTQQVTVTVACNSNNCPMPPNMCLPDQTCVTPPAPVINSFTATPDTIAKGQGSQLAWTTTDATEVSIDQGVGSVAVNGNQTVSPVVTTIYTLTAKNAAGVSVTKQATVTVACNPTNCPTPPNMCLPDQSCAPLQAPVAADQAVSTRYNMPKDITLGATDPNTPALPLQYSIVSGPMHGSLTPGAGAGVTYIPQPGYTGTDRFKFKASNGYLDSPEAVVTITVGNPGVSDIDHITVEPDGKTISITESLIFIAHAWDSANQEILGLSFQWGTSSSDGAIAPQGARGLFRATGDFIGSRTYRVTATAGGKSGSAHVTVVAGSPFAADICGAHAFPVPYKASLGLNGITFTGLSAASKIRIFTTEAYLVRQLYSANGDDVLWDLRNSDGDKVASGVYFYIVDQSNGPCPSKKGKLVIIQ